MGCVPAFLLLSLMKDNDYDDNYAFTVDIFDFCSSISMPLSVFRVLRSHSRSFAGLSRSLNWYRTVKMTDNFKVLHFFFKCIVPNIQLNADSLTSSMKTNH